MRGLIKSAVLTAAIAIVFAPSPARADGYVNPWAGVNFGTNVDNGRGAFGVNAGGMGAGIIGGEASFGYSPSFFGTSVDFGTNTVIDVMGNVMLGIPFGGQYGKGFRPFVTAGLGLVRTQVDGGTLFDVEFSDNSFGWNAGAGFMGYFNDHVGLRGDVRYHRTIDSNFPDSWDFNQGNLHYWRGAVGLVIR